MQELGLLESAYNGEKDGEVRSRILLMLRVKVDHVRPAHAVRELHRTRAWATKWIGRFETEGLEGLKTRKRTGRPPKMPQATMARVERTVTGNRSGWTVREVRELIREEAGIAYSERQIYRLMHKWRMRPVVPEKRALNKASSRERLAFKKA
jgi:transposase